MIDTPLRQWTLLQLISRHSRRTEPARIKARLDGMGIAVTLLPPGPYQAVATGYSRIRGSGVSKTKSRLCAWQISIRSKGS